MTYSTLVRLRAYKTPKAIRACETAHDARLRDCTPETKHLRLTMSTLVRLRAYQTSLVVEA